MGNKNYGPGVSGYLDPTGRNWEDVIFQAGRPLTDAELNLCEEPRLLGLPKLFSGWYSPEVLSTTGNAFFVPSSPDFVTTLAQDVRVNGWNLRIDKTGASTNNVLPLGPGPVGAGTHQVDLVILEVWRILVSATPDGTGKSPSGLIWLNGNVKTFNLLDATVDTSNNLPDDIEDTKVGQETTKRVQIQYRLRVVPNVDIFNYPFGLDDPSIGVNSVPTSPTEPDGAPVTGMPYVPAPKDAGMWVAGDGNPANALGTVDGFMYAVPFYAVFRRNVTPFDKDLNHNGGVTYPGPLDRPDGLFNDVVAATDIADLRMCLSPDGWDFSEVLEKNMALLLDNGLCTEWTSTDRGGSTWGHTVIYADEVGTTTSHPGANLVGQFDNVRRDFSARPVFETMTVQIQSHGVPWTVGQVVPIDPASLTTWPNNTLAWRMYNPSRTCFIDVLQGQFLGADASHCSGTATFTSVTDLAVHPQGVISLTLGTIPTGVTTEDLLVDVLVAYPPGHGLTHTPVADFGANSFVFNDPSMAPPHSAWLFNMDYSHREAHLQYKTTQIVLPIAAVDTVIVTDVVIALPDRVSNAADIVSVVLNGGSPLAFTLSTDGRFLTLTGTGTNPGDVVTVTYTAIRPLPQNGAQLYVWYNYRAPQTLREAVLVNPLTVVPRSIPSSLYSLTVGPGSQDEAYPYPFGYVQTGGVKVAGGHTFRGDYELNAGANIAITEFDADTGLLKLPPFVNVATPPSTFTFTRSSLPPDVDCEGRTYYSVAYEGTGPVGAYELNAYAQDLSDLKRHKVMMPMLVEMPASSLAGKGAKGGQLVLVLLSRWAWFDANNGVYFDNQNPATSTTTASVYRLRGGMFNGRM